MNVGFGNTKEDADGRVLGRRGRVRKEGRRGVQPAYGRGLRRAGAHSDSDRALSNCVRCVPMLVETFGGLGEGLVGVLERASEWRQGRLAASEGVRRDDVGGAEVHSVRISVAVHLSLAQEVAEALGLAVTCDPRA